MSKISNSYALQLIVFLVFTTTDCVPSEFLKIRQNQAMVQKIISQKYPEDPKTLPILEIDNKNFQMNSCD